MGVDGVQPRTHEARTIDGLASIDGFKWIAPLQVNATMSQTTIEARFENHDETDRDGTIETADDDDPVYGKVSRNVVDQLSEYFTLTISDDADVMAEQVDETKNYGKYETPGGAVYGLGINKRLLEDEFGEELPESIGLQFAESDEETFEEAIEAMEEEAEEEAEALLADSDESDDEEEEVEISDEELDLVDQ